jgi:predicted dithiol-disulfide oxidoreductase (DUF899 family)
LTKEEEKIMTDPLQDHKIVSEEKWVEARKALLKKEKEFTALSDQLSQQLEPIRKLLLFCK